MANRGQYLRNKASHDQREFGSAKPRKADEDKSTAWLAGAVAAINQVLVVGEYYGIETAEMIWVGLSQEQLRELSRRGILHMRSLRDESGKFVQFEWALQPAGVVA